jgi:hypothetical protein
VARADRFLPSRCGFAFRNAWSPQPALVRQTPLGRIAVGDASAGLCGGMVFAALDYWHAGRVPPAVQPAHGDPLFGYLVTRLVDSWHLPLGVLRYYRWMTLPDSELARRTLAGQWPRIAAELDRGIPVPLGVVTVASARPGHLPHNHQVLATGYAMTDEAVTVEVYDPNHGPRDDIRIEFDAARSGFGHNLDVDRPVRGFFRTGYTPRTPPA